MPGKFFDPSRSTVVAGDLVVFRNNDLVTHDVRIAGGMFDSGPIVHFSSWSQQIDVPGGYPFVCTLHPFMSGNLDVLAATLAATEDGARGRAAGLSGRAPAGTARIAVEQSVAGGEWTAIGTAAPRRTGVRDDRRGGRGARATASRRRRARARRSRRACRRASPSTSWSSTREAHHGAGSHDAGDDGLHGHAGALLALALPLAPAAARQARPPRPRDVQAAGLPPDVRPRGAEPWSPRSRAGAQRHGRAADRPKRPGPRHDRLLAAATTAPRATRATSTAAERQ